MAQKLAFRWVSALAAVQQYKAIPYGGERRKPQNLEIHGGVRLISGASGGSEDFSRWFWGVLGVIKKTYPIVQVVPNGHFGDFQIF